MRRRRGPFVRLAASEFRDVEKNVPMAWKFDRQIAESFEEFLESANK
jgi:hypothetical protein